VYDPQRVVAGEVNKYSLKETLNLSLILNVSLILYLSLILNLHSVVKKVKRKLQPKNLCAPVQYFNNVPEFKMNEPGSYENNRLFNLLLLLQAASHSLFIV